MSGKLSHAFIHTFIHTYIHIYIRIHIYTYIHHWHCFQNRFKRPCSSTVFFLGKKCGKESWNVNVLWKVVKKFKCKFKFHFFSKYKFFEVAIFFLLITNPVNSILLMVVRMYKILVINEACFSSLQPLP